MDMKQIIRAIIIFLIGLATASIAAYFYFDTTDNDREIRKLEPVSLTGKEEAFITAISGEVYILREDIIITAETGEALYAGDIIKVVDDSFCQIQFANVAAARIKSNSIIKIKKLLNIDSSTDIKTEILTGSMLYRVNKLSEGEKLEVKSDDRIYSVRGTTFFIDRNSRGTHLVVDEGLIAVSVKNGTADSLETSSGSELFTTIDSETEKLTMITERSRHILKEAESLNLINIDTDKDRNILIKTAVKTIPGDAQIYVNGILAGRGNYSGLFLKEENLTFLIRKRGYMDKVLSVKAISNLEYTVYLEPEDPDEKTLENEQNKNAEDNLLSDSTAIIEKLRENLESRNERLSEIGILINELKEKNSELQAEKSSFETKTRKMNSQILELEKQREDLNSEIGELTRKLNESTARENKLRELIKQIQEISSTD